MKNTNLVTEVQENDQAHIKALLNFLGCQRIRFADEKSGQHNLETLLQEAGYEFKREIRLSIKDIPDFLVQVGHLSVIIEMKIKAQRKAIFRQLQRYAQYKEVDAIILYTATSMHLPETINNKPAFVSSMGAGWL